MKFRELRADEVDARVGATYNGDVTLLLYKDARCDMNILDETVGAENWQRKHYECKGNLFCSVGIKFGDEWVWKDDCGTESYTEKEKGEASDSFKRACFNWGLGRELYTAPFIYIKKDKLEYTENGKLKTKFRVKDMEVIDGKITRLCICDQKGNDLFTEGYSKAKKKVERPKCEKCGEEIRSIVGDDNKYISPDEIIEMSKEKTKKWLKEEHIYCAEHLKEALKNVGKV